MALRPSLDDPKAKLARAREHLETFIAEANSFLRGGPYETVLERDAIDGSYVWIVEVRSPPPIRLSIIIGDVIHDLRSCLDHLVWQLALITTTDPYARSEFPIYDVKFHARQNECFDKKGRDRIKHVPHEAQSIIEDVQPYHGRDWPDVYLRLLHELNNADKHRIVVVPKPAIGSFSVSPEAFSFRSPGGLPVGTVATPSGESRYEVLRLPAGLGAQRNQRADFAYEVGVETSESGKRPESAARDLLEMMCLVVEDIVSRCERFFTDEFLSRYGPGF